MGNKGLLGLEVPEKYQGLELSSFDSMRIMKQLGSIDTTLSLFVGLTNVLGVRPILKNAQEEVKENILPIISTGRELGAFALSEDGAGSNPLDLQMLSIPTSNKTWLLNGKKIWSGASAWAGVINTFAKEYDQNGKLQGFTAYCVRLVQGGESLTVGMRGLIQNTIYFNDVEVNELNILGQRGKGMDVAQDAMMYGRLTIASACIGGMKRCLQFINNYASQRKISTGLLIDNAVTRKKIYEISNFIVCIDVLVNKISKMIDKNLPIPQELYLVCKILAPEYFWTSIDHTIQILGGRGYVETNLIPQMMRDARVLRIFEGPTETLSMYLGSKTINVTNSIYDLIVNILGCSEVFEKLEQAIETVLSVKLTNKSSTD
jgi:alkylation response protein AidB-like acyl-CoA dehydrogenase